ncbi:carbon dioxide concentrating mechanism protein CcmM, partial [bacterium]|nr:carbon dioxide concentrating mechanism protein CcmM [bacterium]
LVQRYTFAETPQTPAPTAPPLMRDLAPEPSPSGLAPDITRQVNALVDQGYSIGIEHADPRRYRSGSWQSCRLITATNTQEATEALSQCLQEYRGEYVRIYGAGKGGRINPTLVQRPE